MPSHLGALFRSKQFDNAESSPFVTRFGGTVCGQHGFAVGDLGTYDFCLRNTTNAADFMACYDRDVHGRPHVGVGGSRLAFEGQKNVAGDIGVDCLAWLFSGTPAVCSIHLRNCVYESTSMCGECDLLQITFRTSDLLRSELQICSQSDACTLRTATRT